MSEPTWTCQRCFRSVEVTQDGRGFPPDIARRKLEKLCESNGCPCEPEYRDGTGSPPYVPDQEDWLRLQVTKAPAEWQELAEDLIRKARP